MKNQYSTLKNEYKDTLGELSLITGWTPAQAEKVLEIMTKHMKTATLEQQETKKNAKILATKKLLKNYRNLKISIDSGTKHTQKLLADREYQSLMEKEESIANQKMSATALLTASNRVLWARLNTALDCFKEMCKADRSPSVQRGYPLIYTRYLCESRMNLDAILERFAIEKSTYFRNMGAAVSTLSVILFGSDSAEDFCLNGNL